MPETELARVLHELTPEPPRSLRPGEIARRARTRRGLRVTALAVPVLAAAGAVAVLQSSGGSSQPSVVGDGDPTSTATAEPTIAGTTDPHPQEPYDDMHSTSAPGPLTGGTADMDDDGKLDRVLVRSTNGAVSVELADGRVLTATLPEAGGSERLQALPDLFGTGHRLVLVSTSASGCCGYAPNEAQSYVLALVEGSLVLVRTDDGTPLQLGFNSGRGDNYASITCRTAAHEVVQTGFSPDQHTRRSVTITLSGRTAHVSSPVNSTDDHAAVAKDFMVAQDCPGLTPDGRAS